MDDKTTLPTVDLTNAPLPTEKTLRHRKSLIGQAGSFVIFNLRMLRLITKGKH